MGLRKAGAKVLVHPWQFEESTVALSRSEVSLRPYHVVVSSSLECNVEACLADVPCREGARVKRRRILDHVALENPRQDGRQEAQDQTWIEDGAGEVGVEFDIQRTFICETTRRRQPNSVAQSTTEAHGGGLNPRRVASQAMSSLST